MSGNQTRLRVKLGAAEVEYEGDSLFLKYELMPTLDKIFEIAQARIDSQPQVMQVNTLTAPAQGESKGFGDFTTNTIATMLNAESGADLVIAAAARLLVILKNERATRSQILDEMKLATSFYKATFSNNLTSTLKRLTQSGRLRLVAEDTYGLSPTEQKSLEDKLANAE